MKFRRSMQRGAFVKALREQIARDLMDDDFHTDMEREHAQRFCDRVLAIFDKAADKIFLKPKERVR